MTVNSNDRLGDHDLVRPLAIGAAIVISEVLLVTGYLGLTSTTVTAPRYIVYPFVWINVGLLAFYVGRPRVANDRHRWIGLAVTGGYYLLLLSVAGNVVFGTVHALSLSIMWTTPGWGPILNAHLPGVELHLIPYEVIGYAGLSYLFYANILGFSRGVLSGALGIVTCVSCSMPLWGPLFGLIGGSALGLSGLATAYAYDIGMVLFLVTVALLYYFQRPTRADVTDVSI